MSTAQPKVSKFNAGDATEWMEHSGVSLADVANEDDAAEMKLGAIGFLRAPTAATTQFDFPYDEVLIVTKGSCEVTSDGVTVSAGPGDVVYLPAGVPGTFHVPEQAELVYVASSPYGSVNREAKAELLAQRGQRRTRATSVSGNAIAVGSGSREQLHGPGNKSLPQLVELDSAEPRQPPGMPSVVRGDVGSAHRCP